MIARERLNARPAPVHPSRRRAPARTERVRSTADTSPQDSSPKMQNKPAFHSASGIRAAATPALRPAKLPDKPLAPIEIP
jgi:hypothetical protein